MPRLCQLIQSRPITPLQRHDVPALETEAPRHPPHGAPPEARPQAAAAWSRQSEGRSATARTEPAFRASATRLQSRLRVTRSIRASLRITVATSKQHMQVAFHPLDNPVEVALCSKQ
jgi:hypothetical protein